MCTCQFGCMHCLSLSHTRSDALTHKHAVTKNWAHPVVLYAAVNCIPIFTLPQNQPLDAHGNSAIRLSQNNNNSFWIHPSVLLSTVLPALMVSAGTDLQRTQGTGREYNLGRSPAIRSAPISLNMDVWEETRRENPQAHRENMLGITKSSQRALDQAGIGTTGA